MQFQNVFRAVTISICIFYASAQTDTAVLDYFTSLLASSAPSKPSLLGQSNFIRPPRKRPLTSKELAAKYGHSVEEYTVTTEDGYKLTIFRLRGKRKALPVLLFHGLTDSSDTWLIRGNTSLGITLANNGYDVWLGNIRGNKYSLGHVSLNADVNPSYWNFSFHEVGIYDVSATIDFILKETGASKLNAFGHSQGNTIIFVLLSTRTEYNAKINVMTALAPICYIQNLPPPIGIVIEISPILAQLAKELGVTHVLGKNSLQTLIFQSFAQIPVLGYVVDVYGIIFPICGVDREEFEPEFLPVAGSVWPTSTSVKTLVHFAQVSLRKSFAQYDYGADGNRIAYNSSEPPRYDLSKVEAKVALLAARNDKLSTLANVEILRPQLPNVVKYVINPWQQMNHLDYVWGRNTPTYLYPYIFDILENYN